MATPEELAREKIDALLQQCGWILQNRSTINLSASRGVAIREALLKDRDEVDHLLFVDGKAIGTVKAKPEGYTLTGVEDQSAQLDRVSISTIQRLYSMLRLLFFWDRNTDAARRDRREETGSALLTLRKVVFRLSI